MLNYPVAPEPAQTPAPTPAPAPARPRGTSRGVVALYAIAGVIAVGGVAFAVGRMTAPAAAASTTRTGAFSFRSALGAGSSFAPGAGRVGAAGFGGEAAIRGTVQSITGSTLTLQTASGQTLTIDLSGTTTYHSQAAASASDVKPGSTVQVQLAFDRAAFGGATGGAFGAGGGTGTGSSGGSGAGTSGSGTGTAGGSGAAPLASGAPRTLTASDVMLVTP